MASVGAIDWLARHAPDFGELRREEHSAISDFLLLWSFFEGNALETQGWPKAIMQTVREWDERGLLDGDPFQPELAYFRDRYYSDGAFTHHFHQLHFRRPDREEMVKSVLKGENADPAKVASAALIIVYRYRNNLFHGLKWSYNIQGQLDNFIHANSVLRKAIELHRSPSMKPDLAPLKSRGRPGCGR